MACTPSLLLAFSFALQPSSAEVPTTSAPQLPAAAASSPTTDEGDPKTIGILRFEAEDDVSRTLLYALARVFRQRGHAAGVKAPLSELSGTFGCEPRSPGCMDVAPTALGVDLAIYGSMQRIGDGYRIDLFLAGTTAEVHPHVGVYIPRSKIVGPRVVPVAADLAGRLWPRQPRVTRRRASPPPPPPPILRTASVDYEPTLPPVRRRFPRWAAAGLGASTATAVVGWSLVVAGRVGVRQAEADVNLAAARSLEDTNPGNDISSSAFDLCDAANFSLGGGTVRNAEVSRACERGEQATKTQSAGVAVALIGSVAKVAFGVATLVATRRNKADGRRAKVRVEPSANGAALRF